MNLISHILVILMFCVFLFPIASAQSSETRINAIALQTLLDGANERITEYANAFKNLSAEETKITEVFDKLGNSKRKKTILSDLIIYEPDSEPKKRNLMEYHNVREVDGKAVGNWDKRALNLFKELVDAQSFEKELDKIKKESLRYDTEISAYGLVLTPLVGVVLTPNGRRSFKFTDIGAEKIGENEVVVLKFQQISSNPMFDLKVKFPEFLEAAEPRFRGEVWIELQTKQIRRFWQEVTIDSPRLIEPLVVIRYEAVYHPSEFGIVLPSKIIFESYNPRQNKKDFYLLMRNGKVKPEVYLNKRLTMDYKNFRRFEVTVKADR